MFSNNSIFGPDGLQQNIGNTSVTSGGGTITSVGNARFGPAGGMSADIGNTTLTGNRGLIQKTGNAYYADGVTYTVCGDTLVSSDGRTWTGNNGLSDNDVRNIIINNLEQM